jgi:nitrate/TMAO reductase-like tetraheme cytochrome c subunit
MASRWIRRSWDRLVNVAGRLFILGLFGISILALGMYGSVHYTAQPDFCNSCHIMEPYYESWKSSSHADVACIECHYEPGSIETLEGKFKALSQLAKYVTRTQGTKPWAEVSDQSCMRSGCHSVRMLEGEVQFGRVKFDQRRHLLESRRGRRLPCTTCHSQIVQGEHVAVTPSVCFMCHFMPGEDGAFPEKTGDCLVCHGPPQDPIDVEGRTFEHAEYVARGVSCRECHDPVVEGKGRVGRERCHSCHAEIGHIERFGETAYLHEKHVTEKKVECFECHDDIHHGLLPLQQPRPTEREGCGSCHVDPHGAALAVYSGQGAAGLEDQPSRMYQTRVVCRACHTGRSGYLVQQAQVGGDPHAVAFARSSSGGHGASTIAAAGNVDCIHCHGPTFDGMLAGWQQAVGSQLERLEPLLAELGQHMPPASDDASWEPYLEARRNLELIALDGSQGAHNVSYALDALRVSAERIDRLRGELGVEAGEPATAGFPFVSRDGCTPCHLDVETVVVDLPGGRAFSHGPHLAAGTLDCSNCHSLQHHGQPAPDRMDCASCHHSADAGADASSCSACHTAQQAMLHGEVAGHAPLPAAMGDMDCSDGHGEPPDVVRPSPLACVICHEEGFDTLLARWQAAVSGRMGRLQAARERLSDRLAAAPPQARDQADRALTKLRAVEQDGSHGAHNVQLALALLQDAAEDLDRVASELDPDATPLAEPAPYRPEEGCASCHAGLETHQTVRPDGRSFPHRPHVEVVGLDCSACHSVEDHGQPAFAREQCANCHHTVEVVGAAGDDCTSCHGAQARMVRGEVASFPETPGPKLDMECSSCHGDAPDIAMPAAALCNVCHDEEFQEQLAGRQQRLEELGRQLAEALAERADDDSEPARIARRAYRAVVEDGSRGVHNLAFAQTLLEEALKLLGQ